jgi:hypothetical protein
MIRFQLPVPGIICQQGAMQEEDRADAEWCRAIKVNSFQYHQDYWTIEHVLVFSTPIREFKCTPDTGRLVVAIAR